MLATAVHLYPLDFDRIPELNGKFVYDIKEDSGGNIWLATYANGAYCYNVNELNSKKSVITTVGRFLFSEKLLGLKAIKPIPQVFHIIRFLVFLKIPITGFG